LHSDIRFRVLRNVYADAVQGRRMTTDYYGIRVMLVRLEGWFSLSVACVVCVSLS